VPGLQVVAVRHGDVLVAGGVGVQGADDPTPVSSQSLIDHGSCGKGYTALLASLLHDEGLLDLDAPVRVLVPELVLPDPKTAAQVTVRDLLAHRSGLGRHDLAWILNGGGTGPSCCGDWRTCHSSVRCPGSGSTPTSVSRWLVRRSAGPPGRRGRSSSNSASSARSA